MNEEFLKLINDKGCELTNPNYFDLMIWLSDVKGLHINLYTEFYPDGVNHLWQILWYSKEFLENPDKFKGVENFREFRIVGIDGTGQYGDNNEYPTKFCAIKSAVEHAFKKIL